MAYTSFYAAHVRIFADTAYADTTRRTIKENSDEMEVKNTSKQDAIEDAVDTIYQRCATLANNLEQLSFQ